MCYPEPESPSLSNCHVSSRLINLEVILGDTYLHLSQLNKMYTIWVPRDPTMVFLSGEKRAGKRDCRQNG